ncbi:MAG: hypothetical protein HY962_07100 [Ignavibacteriae bacterium]|nr:hypothetical protein [Ignavibacteriota bacterium]
MNERRAILTGKLTIEKSKRDRITLEIRSLVARMQSLVDPFAEPLDLRLDEAEVALARLTVLQGELRHATQLIDDLEGELYG